MSGLKRIVVNRLQGRSSEREAVASDAPEMSSNSDRGVALFPPVLQDAEIQKTHLPSSSQIPKRPQQSEIAKYTSNLPVAALGPSPSSQAEDRLASMRIDDTARKQRMRNPRDMKNAFRLGELPYADAIPLEKLLEKSARSVTAKKAAAARFSVVTALENVRDQAVLSRAVDQYVPYALTCWDIAEKLKTKGNNISTGIVWESGLVQDITTGDAFDGGFGLEAVMVLMLSALNKLRDVLETEAEFAMSQDQTLVAQIKSMQATAGIFAYTRDAISPTAIAVFNGQPPPELQPDVAGLFCTLCLCVAQALHVRRAALNGMSASTLAKLSIGAKDLANELLASHSAVVQSGTSITADVKSAADDLLLLTSGWAYQYLAVTADGGLKVGAFRAAIERLTKASHSRLVGKVAALDLDSLPNDLDDAVSENRIVHQDAILRASEITFPPGRVLVSPALYNAPRIPKAETASQNALHASK